MNLRFSVTLAAVVCLMGCNKNSPNASDNNAGANATTATPGAASATSTGGQTGEWKTTSSGLKYQVLKHGSGTVSPKATDTVKVHYHGTLLNGTVFDSSVERGEPISFS